MPPIRLTTLGLAVLAGVGGPGLPARSKLLALLVYLARHPGPVRREVLATLFWGEKPEALARQSLRHALMRVRRAVGDAVLMVGGDDVRLAPGALDLDVARFDQYLRAGELAAAVELWQGDFLTGFEDAGGEDWRVWLEAEREGLRRRLAHALATLCDEAEARGDWPLASRWAAVWADALPLDERARLRAAQTTRLVGPPARAAASEVAVPELVGRATAFETLAAAWEGARAGRGAIVLIEGEHGTGKTRLIEEFLHWLRERNSEALVLRARARESQEDGPWATTRALLTGLRHAPGLSGAPDAALAEVAELVSSVRERFPRLPAAHGTTEARARACAQVLADVAAEVPLALVLDDLPAADAESVRLLLGLARDGLRGGLLVLSASTEDLEISGYALALRTVPGCRRVRLDALSAADTEAVIGGMVSLRADVRHALAARIHGDTSGHPGYTVELVRALVDDERLATGPDGVWELHDADAPLPLPHGVRAVLRARADDLSAAARLVLDAAALLGDSAGIDRVARATALLGDELDAAVGELVQYRLLRPCGGDARVRFRHEIVRRCVLDALPPARRALLESRSRTDGPTPARRPRLIAAAALVIAASAGLLAFWTRPDAALPVLAVGEIVDQTEGDPTVRFPLRDLLATRLATVPHLPVISPERMHEVSAQLPAGPNGERALTAARRAGAQEIVQGNVLRDRRGSLRLELRRVNLKTGAVTGAYSVTGNDALELIDAATRALAERFGIPLQHGQPGTPASLVAYRLYEEGLRTYYQGDAAAAHRFFSAAVKEDSTFAMAAFYDFTSQFWAGLLESDADAKLARVVQLAEHAPARESLLIRALWASHVHAPERLALAETLAIRYPHEPDGHLLLGRGKLVAGDFAGSLVHYRRVLALDSGSMPSRGAPCRACDAYTGIIGAYQQTDSLAAAIRTAREWTRRQPEAALPWVHLASALEYDGRFEDALAARRRAMPYQPANRTDPVYGARIAIRQADYAAADALLRQRMSDGAPAVSREAAWYLVISLRQQGRLREAMKVALAYHDTTSEAVINLEAGAHRAAARIFGQRVAHRAATENVAPTLNRRLWSASHAATAHAAAGDTIALRALADTMAALVPQTSAARNRRLGHYATGLLYQARGDHRAAAAAFERALHSTTNGYSRINLDLARSLLATGEPRRAIAILQAPLRGPLDAGNYYVTHTELRALLGEAYEAAALPDSAAAQYRRVLEAWRNADPVFHARRDAIRGRLDAMTRAPGRSARLTSS